MNTTFASGLVASGALSGGVTFGDDTYSDDMSSGIDLQEWHQELRSKWKKDGAAIDRCWSAMTEEQRKQCIFRLNSGTRVLKHSRDRSLGHLSTLIPEWNLRDLTAGEDHLLHLMADRAVPDLIDQFRVGPSGKGDSDFVQAPIRAMGGRDPDQHRTSYMMFVDGNQYGTPVELDGAKKKQLKWAIGTGNMVPFEIGQLILARQNFFMENLNEIADIILEQSSKKKSGKGKKGGPKQVEAGEAAAGSIAKLKIEEEPDEYAFPGNIVFDRMIAHEAYLSLLASEPGMLAREVNRWFSSRPELVADEKGRSLPLKADEHASGALLDAVQNAVQAAAVWTYINALLGRLESSGPDKLRRSIISQEIANVCNLDYVRLQSLLKRHLAKGSKLFKRVFNGFDAVGNPNIKLKGKPQDFEANDPQLSYLLRLCQPETTASKAMDWIKKLGSLYKKVPLEREKFSLEVVDLVGLISLNVGASLSLSDVLPVPSRKKGQFFVTRAQQLVAELNQLKKSLDPVLTKSSLDDGNMDGALKRLDQRIVEKAGTKLSFLYEDLIEDSLSYLDSQYDNAKATREKDWTAHPIEPLKPLEELIELRKEKDKARPPSNETLDILSCGNQGVASSTIETEFEESVEFFKNLLGRSGSRSQVPEHQFRAVMQMEDFEVSRLEDGINFVYVPPKSMTSKRPLFVSWPFKSQFEGDSALMLRQRLNRAYGWDETTFQAEDLNTDEIMEKYGDYMSDDEYWP